MVTGVVTFVALAAYPLQVALFGPLRVSGALQSPGVFSADLLSFVTPPGYRYLGAAQAAPIAATFTGNMVEAGSAYLGLTGLVLLVVALVLGRRSSIVRFAGLLTIGMLVLALGARLHVAGHVTEVRLPGLVIAHLPLMQSVLPVRLMLFTWLGVAVVLGVVGDRLVSSGRTGAIAVAVSSVLLIVPIFPIPPLLSTPTSAPEFFSPHGQVTRIPRGSVALVTPFSNVRSSTAMYWQMSSDFRFRMPEGEAYVPGPSLSPPPSDLQQDLVALDAGNYPRQPPADERARALANLKQWNVDTIVVGPSPGAARIGAFFTRVTGRPPERAGGVWVWWNVRATVGG
jgi:hypothetical protein